MEIFDVESEYLVFFLEEDEDSLGEGDVVQDCSESFHYKGRPTKSHGCSLHSNYSSGRKGELGSQRVDMSKTQM